MIDLFTHKYFWAWDRLKEPSLCHFKSYFESLFDKSPVKIQEITLEEKYLCINGDRGFLRVRIYGV